MASWKRERSVSYSSARTAAASSPRATRNVLGARPSSRQPEPPGVEEDILDLVLCPTCGADNDPELEECEICGTALRGRKEPSPVATEASLPIPPATRPRPVSRVLDKLDEFL